ncbi:FecR family protein [Chitinophaga sp.]|uniref:FecR family protein n=1 Tax=Chitinophaga sp. TaxID=1869181 RepID=UPI002F920015
MHNERMAQLMARKLSGEASPEEIKELDSLLQEHPADALFLSLLADYWSTPIKPLAEEAEDPEAHFRHVLEAAADQMPEDPFSDSRPRYHIRRFLTMAAALTGLLVLSWWGVKQFRRPHQAPMAARIETIAKPGAKSRLLLPDGSIVWLNSGSRISYPANFTDSIREIELEGEAYFDVAKDPGRPFMVRTRDLNVRVLGTAFNVKCYPKDHKTEATLIRGLIQVSGTGDNQQQVLLLHPHEKVVIDRLPENVSDQTNNTAPLAAANNMTVKYLKKNAADTAMVETAWVYNKLVFDGENFREMSDEMERWFNVKIVFNDATVAGYRFHAKFENENIHDVLSALRLSLPFTFKIENNEVNIYK